MWRILGLTWLVSSVWFPWLGGGWATFFIPRTTALVWGALLTPWWAGTWTGAEWGLVALAAAGTLRQWHLWGLGHGAVWVGGLLLLRAVRGLPVASQGVLKRRWWWGLMPVMAYAGFQYMFPRWDLWFSPAISSTLGGPHFLAEAMLPVIFSAPWPAVVGALAVMGITRQRGPWIAATLAAVIFRRWRLAVPLVLVTLALVVLIRPGLGTMAVRWEVWGRTVTVIRAHPWAGVGTGGYPFNIDQSPMVLAPVERIGNAHNEYLERAAEWGIPGAALFTGWVVARAWRSPALTAMALAAVTGFTFTHPLTWALWCVLAGLEER